MSPIVLLIFIAAFVVTGAIVFVLFGSSPRERMRKRASTLKDRKTGGLAKPGTAIDATSLKRTEKTSFALAEQLAKRYVPNQTALKERLARSGFKISLGTYALINLGVGGVVFVVITVATGLNPTASAAIGLATGIMIPHLAVGHLATKRRNAFVEGLPDALDLMVRGLKAGLPITESIATVAREMQGPIREEFIAVADGVRFGGSMDTLLWDVARRMQAAEFKFFVISLSIQRETGGNLTETLSNLSDIIRKRRQMRKKVKALSSEARASAYILGAMPFVMFFIMHFLNEEYVSTLYTDPRGMIMLGAGLLSMAIGGLIMAKMVRFEI